jgi:hypothetical protein
LTSTEIEKKVISFREEKGLPLLGVAPSNIRRQVLRLRDLLLVERIGNNYRINENASLSELSSEKIEKYYLNSIISRVREYFVEADSVFRKKEGE